MFADHFRYKDGVLPNLAALSFTLLGFVAGVVLLTQPFWLPRLAGVLLVTLTLTWSAYFIHEFAHHAIFKTGPLNMRWGAIMSWVNGSCFAPFDNLRRKHMRHHVERADVITFDVKAFLLAAPAWQRNTVLALEWLYIPVVEFLMRGFVIAMPFRAGQPASARRRVIGILVVRTTAFAALGWYSLPALLLYCVAYLLFVTLLRFADCFQHTYDAYPIIGDAPVPDDKLRDRVYEQANTYSDIVGPENRILNMLWLNFGFHNAHHEKPAMPWHRLPALHRELYADRCVQVIPVRALLKSFHVHRVNRILANDYGKVLPYGEAGRADGFLGAAGVSFLTAV